MASGSPPGVCQQQLVRSAQPSTALAVDGLLGGGGLIVIVGIIDDRWDRPDRPPGGPDRRSRNPVRERGAHLLPERTMGCSA
jgi:hypothetical protein